MAAGWGDPVKRKQERERHNAELARFGPDGGANAVAANSDLKGLFLKREARPEKPVIPAWVKKSSMRKARKAAATFDADADAPPPLSEQSSGLKSVYHTTNTPQFAAENPELDLLTRDLTNADLQADGSNQRRIKIEDAKRTVRNGHARAPKTAGEVWEQRKKDHTTVSGPRGMSGAALRATLMSLLGDEAEKEGDEDPRNGGPEKKGVGQAKQAQKKVRINARKTAAEKVGEENDEADAQKRGPRTGRHDSDEEEGGAVNLEKFVAEHAAGGRFDPESGLASVRQCALWQIVARDDHLIAEAVEAVTGRRLFACRAAEWAFPSLDEQKLMAQYGSTDLGVVKNVIPKCMNAQTLLWVCPDDIEVVRIDFLSTPEEEQAWRSLKNCHLCPKQESAIGAIQKMPGFPVAVHKPTGIAYVPQALLAAYIGEPWTVLYNKIFLWGKNSHQTKFRWWTGSLEDANAQAVLQAIEQDHDRVVASGRYVLPWMRNIRGGMRRCGSPIPPVPSLIQFATGMAAFRAMATAIAEKTNMPDAAGGVDK